MTLISPNLRQIFEDLRKRLASPTTVDPLAINKAEVRLVNDQHSEAKVRGFTVVQDEPESVGGGGRGPTPTDYLIASVGFCENVILARNAVLAGVSIDSLETTVTGQWDRRGLFEIDGVKPFFQNITVETRVLSKDPVERIIEVARETHRRCPVHATLSRATEMIFILDVNGQKIKL
ncbi:MAG TPA: OsmC family protein [Candidatus Bathyarchaeia archaeon]|nr:OsmC family protein [Candidatus Bathyarchaeia archaeon]